MESRKNSGQVGKISLRLQRNRTTQGSNATSEKIPVVDSASNNEEKAAQSSFETKELQSSLPSVSPEVERQVDTKRRRVSKISSSSSSDEDDSHAADIKKKGGDPSRSKDIQRASQRERMALTRSPNRSQSTITRFNSSPSSQSSENSPRFTTSFDNMDAENISPHHTDSSASLDNVATQNVARARIATAAKPSTSATNPATRNISSTRVPSARPSARLATTVEPSTSSTNVYNTPEMLDLLKNSALMDGKFFKVCATVTDIQRVPVSCQFCTEHKTLIGSLTVSTNLVKHLRRLHPEVLDEYYAYKKIKRVNMKRPKPSTENEDERPAKRPKMFRNIGIEQDTFLNRVLQFIIDTVSPLSIVDDPSFKDLFQGVNVKLVSRRTVTRRLAEMNDQRVTVTKEWLSKAKFVCTTADVWSAKKRSFIGVTAHFIDEDFKRQSFPLACKRFKGTHSYDKIAEILSNIHDAYGLDSRKIVATVTDNAKNFVKAFEEFGINISPAMLRDPKDRNDIPIEVPSNAEESESDLDGFDSSDIESFESPVSLPGHLRCSSHTLNLVATTDLLRAIKEDTRLHNRHVKTIENCTKLWHKAALPKSAEIIIAAVGHTFSYPVVTRWNSLYDALSQIRKSKDHLPTLFDLLDLKDPFTAGDVSYVEEYCEIMAPIARALDILQGDNVCYGILLPTLTILKNSLVRSSQGNLNYGKKLAQACLNGLLKRFDSIFTIGDEASRAVIAAITHPAFKLRWFEKANQTYKLNFDLNRMRNMFLKAAEPFHVSQPESSQEDAASISSFLKIHESQRVDSDSPSSVNADSSNTPDMSVSLLSYLNDKRKQLSMLDDYPLVKNMFFMYNTPLTSSAPVERPFSFAGITNTPKRNALSDKNFEQLVLLKSFNKTAYKLNKA